MENSPVDRKALAAALLGCAPDELLGFRDEGLSGVVVVAPDGSKHHLPEELLRRAQAWLVELPGEQVSKPAEKTDENIGLVSEPANHNDGMANSVRGKSACTESHPTKTIRTRKGKRS